MPKAESAEFSRLWLMLSTDGDFDPVDGGVKKEFGRLRIDHGTCSGLFESGFNTLSNNACRSESEF